MTQRAYQREDRLRSEIEFVHDRSDVYPCAALSERWSAEPAIARLPAEATALVGRARELHALHELLSEGARLITVHGAGGMGKTRLALRFVAEAFDGGSFPGGVHLCELAHARGSSELVSALATSLEVPLAARDDDADAAQLGAALAARGAVVVLFDNFEQLEAGCDAALARWLAAAPEAVFVVTSRRRLGVAGEHCFDVGPLATPDPEERDPETIAESDAVRLFVERARMASIDLALDARNAADVAAIVRRVDGMPLAIELCAARLRLLSLSELRSMLRDRFVMLESRGGGCPRQLTLRSTLDWSWSMLTPCQRSVLAQCSVFRGGCDLRAAQEVLDTSAHPDQTDVLFVLESLCDHSLLRVETSALGETRCRLYESVREYAAEHLTDADHVRDRHAAHYARLAQRASAAGDADVESEARLALEKDNLLAAADHGMRGRDGAPRRLEDALAILIALEPLFVRRGPVSHYARLLEDALLSTRGRRVDGALMARALLSRGRALSMIGKGSMATACLRGAMGYAERVSDHRVLAAAAIEVGWTYATQGRLDESDAAFRAAEVALQQAPRDLLLQGRLLQKRGHARYRRGHRAEAEADLQRAAQLFRSVGARRDEAFTLGWLGFIADGRPERAIPYFRRAIEMLERLYDPRQRAWQLQYLAVFELEVGKYDQADEHFCEALEIQRRVGDRVNEAATLARHGALALEVGDPATALERLERAHTMLEECGDRLYRGEALAFLGAAEAMAGLHCSAAIHFDEAHAMLEALGYPCLDGVELLAMLAELDPSLPAHRRAAGVARARAALRDPRVDWSYALTRFARRLLERALSAAAPSAPAPQPAATNAPVLHVAADGHWFQLGNGWRADLSRRRALRRILMALVNGRQTARSEPLTVAELLEAGWPRQRCVGSSGDARVYTAITRLRRLGLGTLLRHDGAGYQLACPVHLEPAS